MEEPAAVEKKPPLWKRVLFFDLGLPGKIIESGLNALHVLFFVAMTIELLSVPKCASKTCAQPANVLDSKPSTP